MDSSPDQPKSTKQHCKYCFDVISAALNNQPTPAFPESIQKLKTPLFVTWNIIGDELRGCIGTFSHEKIEKMLPQYALISAFEDSRFEPISLNELSQLSVSVSLLVNFQENKSALDWIVGKHGIIIDFTHNGFSGHGTFLPEVAAEEQWNQRTTLEYLIRKTGYKGRDYDEVISKINLTTYESSKCSLDYAEYLKM